jgi:hypothetical protein
VALILAVTDFCAPSFIYQWITRRPVRAEVQS